MHEDIRKLLKPFDHRDRQRLKKFTQQWFQKHKVPFETLRGMSAEQRLDIRENLIEAFQDTLKANPMYGLAPGENPGSEQNKFLKESEFERLRLRPMLFGEHYYQGRRAGGVWRSAFQEEQKAGIDFRYPLIYAPGTENHGRIMELSKAQQKGLTKVQQSEKLKDFWQAHQAARAIDIKASQKEKFDYKTGVTFSAARPDTFTRKGKQIEVARGNIQNRGQFASKKAVLDTSMVFDTKLQAKINAQVKAAIKENYRKSQISKNPDDEATGTTMRAIEQGTVTAKPTSKGWEFTFTLADINRPGHSWEGDDREVSTHYYVPRVTQGRPAVFPKKSGSYLLFKRGGEIIVARSVRPSRKDLNFLMISNEQRNAIAAEIKDAITINVNAQTV